MWKYLSTIILLVLVIVTIGFVRGKFNRDMKSPLHTELELAANFGELRPDHFHMGLDIRTDGKENLPVYAIEDGYISRIMIGAGGYGKAIFITHSNGLTSLYAHLNKFSGEAEKYLRQSQYKSKSWQQDIDIPADRFPVSKGELVAYSGNTGHSEGPHLHFELRDTRSGNNLNPALYGFVVDDHTPPLIKGLYWYDRRYSTYESGPTDITGRKIVKVSSPLISFGIRAEDRVDDSRFRYGVFRTQVWMDEKLVHDMSMNNFSDADSRYVNASIDYSTRIRKGQYIQHLSRLPGNQLPVFGDKNGLISLPDHLPHEVHIRVTDIAGNQSDLEFTVQKGNVDPVTHRTSGSIKKMTPGQVNILNGRYSVVQFNKNSFYDTVAFWFKEDLSKNKDAVSPKITLHNPSVPVHQPYSVSIQSNLNSGDKLRERIVMRFTGFKRKALVKGKWNGNKMRGEFNELGSVELVVDTIAPEININDEFSPENKRIIIGASDNLGEIAGFKGELDGQWILFAQKGNQFTYEMDEHCKPGKHRLTINVTDVAGNVSTRNVSFETR